MRTRLRDIFNIADLLSFSCKKNVSFRKNERSSCQYQEVVNDRQEVSQIIHNRS